MEAVMSKKAPSAKKKLRSSAQKIAETDNGRLDLVSNELLLTAVDVDPPKMRLHARTEQLVKGAYTWATQRQDGKYEEVAMLIGKQDERVRENPYDFTGAIEFFIRKWVQGTPDDSQFRRKLTILSDGAWFDVPIYAPNISNGTGGGSTAAPTYLQSPDGRYQLHAQGDGNLVWYDTATTPWTALWNTGTQR
jgi:hypothetical protein